MQVTAVARPHNQHPRKAEKNTHTAILPDGGFLLGGCQSIEELKLVSVVALKRESYPKSIGAPSKLDIATMLLGDR